MKKDITKALLIYYYFPPYAAGGSYRPAKMAKYLPGFHISPTIIAADNIPRRPLDEHLMAEVPRHLDVRRLPVRFEHSLYYKLMYKLGRAPSLNRKYKPETTIKWVNDVLPIAERLLDEKDTDIFLVSAPPWSMISLGTKLKERTGKKFILEYRDPWTLGPFYKPPDVSLIPEFQAMEEIALRAADAVVMVTDTFAELMLNRWPFLAGKLYVVPNGYDPDDFPEDGARPAKWERKFVILYAGSLYEGYDTDIFIDAVGKWMESNPALKDKVLLSYVGFMDRRQKRYIEESGMGGMVEFSGYMPHKSAVALQCTADLLIMALPGIPNAGGHISAKVYEYMASGTPVLASMPEGEMSSLLRKAQCGIVVPPDDASAISTKLDLIYRAWEAGELGTNPDDDFISAHTRRNAAEKLADVIKEVSNL